MKTIIYLDQNYVSDLTKARLGIRVVPNVAKYYQALHDALREAVDRNVIVCPVSEFHYSESEMNTRLEPDIYHTLEEMYCGVRILPFDEVIKEQVRAALHAYLDIRLAPSPKWKEAFSQDPHGECDDPPAPIRHRGLGESWADMGRQIKQRHGQEAGEPHAMGGLEEQKRAEALQYIFWLYLDPMERLALGYTDIFTSSALGLFGNLLSAYSERLGRTPTPQEIATFLGSEQLIASPFIDVYSSLRARMVASGGERRPKGSDLNDVLIASSVLPYCDLFATDGHIKQLILSLKLDKQYDVTVFGSRKADVLALTSHVRTLASS